MSFGKKFGIQAAMEELDEAAAAEAGETTEVVEMPADEETVDIALVETTEAADAVDNGGDSIEEAVGDAETLGDVADKMEATEETGGMDEKAAAIAEVAIEALYERLHVTRVRSMPGMESFGSQSSRMKATNVAVESIREDLKKVWAAIVTMGKKVFEFVQNFFRSLFVSTEKMKAKAEKLLKAVESVKGTAQTNELADVGFAGKLSIGGSTSVDGANAQLEKLQKQASDFVEMLTSVTAFADEIEKPIKNKEAFDATTATGSGPSDGFKVDESGKYGKAPEGCAVAVTEEQLGNKCFKYVYPVTEEAGAKAWEALANMSFTAEVFDEKQKEVRTAPVMTADEMTATLKTVLATVDAIEKLKPATKKVEDQMSTLLKIAAKAAVLNIPEDKTAFNRGRVVSRALSKSTSTVTKPAVLLTKLLVEASFAQMDWVVKSAAQYKGAAVKDLPAPDKKEEAATV